MSLRDEAARLLEFDLHPIPLEPRGKKPLVPWREYQTFPPTFKDIEKWWNEENETKNLGAVLGRGIFAVDLDGGKEAEKLLNSMGVHLPEGAPRSKTGNGYHVFLRGDGVPDCVGLLSTNGQKPQVDIRGIGYVVAPPSIHPNGTMYEWLISLENGIPEAPKELIELIKNRKNPLFQKRGNWVVELMNGAKEGGRDNACARLAGYFIGKNIEPSIVKVILTDFGNRCLPPFPQSEIFKCVESIASRQSIDGLESEYDPEFISDVVEKFIDSLDKKTKMVPTTFSGVDNLLHGGFVAGELIYLGARPGVGKTAMALQILFETANKGLTTLMVSREMLNISLIKRMFSQQLLIPSGDLRSGNVSDEIKKKIRAEKGKISALPILLDDRTVTIDGITGIVSRYYKYGISLLIVDHLQLIRSSGQKDRRAQVEAASQGLKNIAIQFKIPVLCMSTLARPMNRDNINAPPSMASLRESGELEHDADIVLLLHREFKSEECKCIVAKNRDGRVGETPIIFQPQFVKFINVIESEEDAAKDGWQKGE